MSVAVVCAQSGAARATPSPDSSCLLAVHGQLLKGAEQTLARQAKYIQVLEQEVSFFRAKSRAAAASSGSAGGDAVSTSDGVSTSGAPSGVGGPAVGDAPPASPSPAAVRSAVQLEKQMTKQAQELDELKSVLADVDEELQVGDCVHT